jgi:hypothetical protein
LAADFLGGYDHDRVVTSNCSDDVRQAGAIDRRPDHVS